MKTKSFGLAIAMALALTAFAGASSASANYFVSPGAGGAGETTWTGSIVSVNKPHKVVLVGESFQCSDVTFTGKMVGETANTITVTPKLSECTYLGQPVSWAVNNCKFVLDADGPMDIVGCEPGIRLETSGCLRHIGNQKGLNGIGYTNSLEGSTQVITAAAALTSLTYTSSGGCFAPTGTFHSGEYAGAWKVKGTRGGASVSVRVEVEAPPPPVPVFEAEEAPVSIAGSHTGAFKRMQLGSTLLCNGYTLSGTAENVTSKEISLVPAYSGCKFGGVEIPDGNVDVGSCLFAFNADGKFAISGTGCAADPIVITRPGCAAEVGPQSGFSGVKYTNEGSGKLRSVSLSSGTMSGLKYTLYGPGCGTEGTFSTGSINQVSKLTATNSGGGPQGISVS